jgi:DNA polymerase-3 subunit gamma/tau
MSAPADSMKASGTLTEGSLALAPELEPAPQPEQQSVSKSATSALHTPEAVQSAIVRSLVDADQTSAAQVLSEARWQKDEREWKVTVGVTETMLPLMLNSDARKLAERTLRDSGTQPARILFLASGQPKTPTKTAPLPLPAGGVHQLALENPLVQKARDLFQAEIRAVQDLRRDR